MDSKLVRDIRLLKAYSACMTVGFAVLLLTAARPERKAKFSEIDVERINIIEPDGKLDLVITDKSHFPPPMWKGKPMEIGRQGATAHGVPGMVFYNAEGDEAGGLAIHSANHNGKHEAGSGLIFDQFEQDQVLGIEYDEQDGQRNAGLHVWERPNKPIIDLVKRSVTAQNMPEGDAKKAALKELQEAEERGEFGGQTRVFVGKNDKNTSEVTLGDVQGKPRIRMTVEASGQSKLEFLDAEGKVVYSLPPGQ